MLLPAVNEPMDFTILLDFKGQSVFDIALTSKAVIPTRPLTHVIKIKGI